MIVECNVLMCNPEYDNLIEENERIKDTMGYTPKIPKNVPKYLNARLCFDPCCIEAHHENFKHKGYCNVNMLNDTFVVKIDYDKLLALRKQIEGEDLMIINYL
jgi:hypothetical protein